MFGGLAFLVGGNMAIAASGQGGVLVRVDPGRGRSPRGHHAGRGGSDAWSTDARAGSASRPTTCAPSVSSRSGSSWARRTPRHCRRRRSSRGATRLTRPEPKTNCANPAFRERENLRRNHLEYQRLAALALKAPFATSKCQSPWYFDSHRPASRRRRISRLCAARVPRSRRRVRLSRCCSPSSARSSRPRQVDALLLARAGIEQRGGSAPHRGKSASNVGDHPF